MLQNGLLFVQDPSMTDWLWEQEECKEQKQRSMNFRKDRQKFMEPDEQEKRSTKKLRRVRNSTLWGMRNKLTSEMLLMFTMSSICKVECFLFTM